MKRKILFIDCFNTIIKRRVSEKQLLYNWSVKLGKEFQIEPSFLFYLYKKYERKIFIKNKIKTGEGEFNFKDVLRKMDEHLQKIGISTENFCQVGLETYIQTETENQFLNEKLINNLRKIKESGEIEKIYLVSDFYCEKQIVEEWLKNLKVLDLFDEIFISCDFCLSKRTGKLYKLLLKKLSLDKKNIMMIGDNSFSDIFRARMKGFKAIKIKKEKLKNEKDLKIKLKKGFYYPEFNKIFQEYNGNYNYSNYAFPLYLYIKRLYLDLKERNVKDIFFMAREGQFLKKMFDYFCEVNGYKINSHYLYVSRNSVLVASLASIEKENFEIMLRSILNMNVQRFLTTLNYSKQDIEKIKNETNLDIFKNRFNFTKAKEFEKLKTSPTFLNVYEQHRKIYGGGFKRYLESFNVDFEKNGMFLVDVGWYGTIQDYIAKFFDGAVQTYGYYIGTLHDKNIPYSKKLPLFFGKSEKKRFGRKVLRHRRLDYEQICRADHNRVKGYIEDNGKFKIIFGDEVDDNKNFNEHIKPLQDQIFYKFQKICQLDFKTLSFIEPTVIEFFYKMFCCQSKEDFEWLRIAENCSYDNFARIGYTAQKFNDKLRIFAYKTLDFGFFIKNSYVKHLRYKKHIKN